MTIYCEKVPSLPPGSFDRNYCFSSRTPQFRKRSYRLFIIPLFAFENKVFPLVNYAVIFLFFFFFFSLSRTRKSAYLRKDTKDKKDWATIGHIHSGKWKRRNIRPTFLVIKRRRTTSINERTSSTWKLAGLDNNNHNYYHYQQATTTTITTTKMCIALYLRAWGHCVAVIIGGCADRVAQYVLPSRPDVRFGIKLLPRNI